jgi:hypothetical protein
MFPPDPRVVQEDAKPERLHRVSWLVVIPGFAALMAFAVIPGIRLKQRDAAFRDIRQNDTKQRVVELMGAGDASAEGLPELERYWGDEANPRVTRDNIKSALTWRLRFLTGAVTWQVGFDDQGRAIAKHRYD